jgi:hypothetical protein
MFEIDEPEELFSLPTRVPVWVSIDNDSIELALAEREGEKEN